MLSHQNALSSERALRHGYKDQGFIPERYNTDSWAMEKMKLDGLGKRKVGTGGGGRWMPARKEISSNQFRKLHDGRCSFPLEMLIGSGTYHEQAMRCLGCL